MDPTVLLVPTSAFSMGRGIMNPAAPDWASHPLVRRGTTSAGGEEHLTLHTQHAAAVKHPAHAGILINPITLSTAYGQPRYAHADS